MILVLLKIIMNINDVKICRYFHRFKIRPSAISVEKPYVKGGDVEESFNTLPLHHNVHIKRAESLFGVIN